MEKNETRKPVIRVRTFHGGVYAHNYRACLVARTKGEAIKIINEAYPGDYEIQDITDRRDETRHVETSNTEPSDISGNPA